MREGERERGSIGYRTHAACRVVVCVADNVIFAYLGSHATFSKSSPVITMLRLRLITSAAISATPPGPASLPASPVKKKSALYDWPSGEVNSTTLPSLIDLIVCWPAVPAELEEEGEGDGTRRVNGDQSEGAERIRRGRACAG